MDEFRDAARNRLAGMGQQPDARPDQIADEAIYGGLSTLPRKDVMKRNPDGSLVYKRFVLSSVGLSIPDDVTDAEMIDIGQWLRSLERSLQWHIGDWLNRAERVWGEVYSGLDQYTYDTLKDYAYVARNVQLSVRTDNLSFGHHKLVAKLPIEGQKAWLEWAVRENASIEKMRKAMQSTKPKRGGDAMRKQAKTWVNAVMKASPRIDRLTPDQRSEVREQARWLANYFKKIADNASE